VGKNSTGLQRRLPFSSPYFLGSPPISIPFFAPAKKGMDFAFHNISIIKSCPERQARIIYKEKKGNKS